MNRLLFLYVEKASPPFTCCASISTRAVVSDFPDGPDADGIDDGESFNVECQWDRLPAADEQAGISLIFMGCLTADGSSSVRRLQQCGRMPTATIKTKGVEFLLKNGAAADSMYTVFKDNFFVHLCDGNKLLHVELIAFLKTLRGNSRVMT